MLQKGNFHALTVFILIREKEIVVKSVKERGEKIMASNGICGIVGNLPIIGNLLGCDNSQASNQQQAAPPPQLANIWNQPVTIPVGQIPQAADQIAQLQQQSQQGQSDNKGGGLLNILG